MKTLLRKLGPVMAVFLAATWMCYGHLWSNTSEIDLGDENMTRLNRELLQPEVPPPVLRDPLSPVKQPEQVTAVEEETLESFEEQVVEAFEPVSLSPEKLAAAFTLNGTFVSTQQKSALINDELCFEGDAVTMPLASNKLCLLAQVEQDHVVLDVEEMKIKLGYDLVSVHVSKPTVAPQAATVPGFLRRMNNLLTFFSGKSSSDLVDDQPTRLPGIESLNPAN